MSSCRSCFIQNYHQLEVEWEEWVGNLRRCKFVDPYSILLWKAPLTLNILYKLDSSTFCHSRYYSVCYSFLGFFFSIILFLFLKHIIAGLSKKTAKSLMYITTCGIPIQTGSLCLLGKNKIKYTMLKLKKFSDDSASLSNLTK